MDTQGPRVWLLVDLQGLVALIFGIVLLAFVVPGRSPEEVLRLFGAFAFIYGILDIVGGLAARRGDAGWGLQVLGGLVGIALGWGLVSRMIGGFMAPLDAVMAWGLAIGILEGIQALRSDTPWDATHAIGGGALFSLAAGVWIAFDRPAVLPWVLVLVLGVSSVVKGLTWLVRAYYLRG